MKALAFDTSSKTGTIVALEWQAGEKGGFEQVRLVSEWSLSLDTAFHSERLLWSIHQVLEAARWKLEDLDVLGVGIGPGSFTGLRIGLTTARTLATVLDKPLVGVSSLAALVRPVALAYASDSKSAKKTYIIGATDAAKGELFAMHGYAGALAECVVLAQGDQPGLWKRGAVEEVVGREALVESLKKKLKQAGSRWLVVGEARSRYSELWQSLPKKTRLEHSLLYADAIQGRYLGMLVWEGIQAGLLNDALGVHPRYLRAPDAELKLEAGLLPPGPKRVGQA